MQPILSVQYKIKPLRCKNLEFIFDTIKYSLMGYKNLILDLDDTLYSYARPHQIGLAKVLSEFSSKFKISSEKVQETFSIARKRTHTELLGRAASHNRLLYFQKMLEMHGCNGISDTLYFYDCYWDTFLNEIQLFDTVLDVLERQKTKGNKICILTDLTAHIQYRKIEKLGLTDYVDFLVTSEEVGAEKPHPHMFMKALFKLGGNTANSLMIGDNWDKDIVGANNLGIEAIWINHNGENKTLMSGVKEVSNFEEVGL